MFILVEKHSGYSIQFQQNILGTLCALFHLVILGTVCYYIARDEGTTESPPGKSTPITKTTTAVEQINKGRNTQ